MLIEESKRRQNELKKQLRKMAMECMEDVEIRKMAITFKSLYSEGFRHNYSEFFPFILELSKDESGYSLDYLSNNLEALRALVEDDYIKGEKEFKGLYMPLSKLSDHLNLEIGRYSYYSTSEEKVKDLEKRNRNLQVELKTATQELNDAKKTVSSVQTELISVLSIFAAIVLTFSGSMSLIGSAFTSISNAPGLKVIFFVLLSGFIVCNIIFLMLYIVGKITGRNIYARCNSKECSCGENGNPKCCGINRIRKRLPYVFWLNISFLILMVFDVTIWYLDKIFNFIP